MVARKLGGVSYRDAILADHYCMDGNQTYIVAKCICDSVSGGGLLSYYYMWTKLALDDYLSSNILLIVELQLG